MRYDEKWVLLQRHNLSYLWTRSKSLLCEAFSGFTKEWPRLLLFYVHVYTTCNTETHVSLVKGWHSHAIISTMGYQLRLNPQHLLISHAAGHSLMMVCCHTWKASFLLPFAILAPVTLPMVHLTNSDIYIPMAACSQRIGILMLVAAAWELPLKVLQEAVHGLPAAGTPFHPTVWPHSTMPVGCWDATHHGIYFNLIGWLMCSGHMTSDTCHAHFRHKCRCHAWAQNWLLRCMQMYCKGWIRSTVYVSI